MFRRFKTYFRSVYVQLMLLVLISVALLYFFFVLLNILASNDLKKKTIENNISSMEYYANNFERDVTSIMAAQKRILVRQELLSLSQGKYENQSYQRKLLINSIQKELAEICDMGRLVEEVYIYIPLIDKKLSSEKMETLSSDDAGVIQKAVNEEMYSYPFMRNGDEVCINLSAINTALSSYDTIVPLFVISVVFSEEILKEELHRMAGNVPGIVLGVSPDFYIAGQEDESSLLSDEIADIVRRDKTEGQAVYLENVNIIGEKYTVIYKRPQMLNLVFAVGIPSEYFFGSIQGYMRWLWLITVITFVMIFIISLNLYRRIKRPLNTLIEAFEKTDGENFSPLVGYDKNDEFSYVYEGFNQMLMKIRQLVKSVYEQKIYVQSAQLKQLQCQINPHFLYNTMSIIYRMSKSGNCEKIARLTECLSKYYQYITKGTLDEVQYKQEVDHARYYVEIQLIRFSERLTCRFDPIVPGCENIMVPKLMLQPILENAFIHGVEKRAENAVLTVRQYAEGNDMVVSVEDNGAFVDEKKLAEIQASLSDEKLDIYASGLINVHRRLKIRFGDEYGIAVFADETRGFKVVIRIPAKLKEIEYEDA